jgi:hypothetical protein
MENKKTVLIDLHYLPSLDFFACIMNFDKVIVETHENYQKQSFRNRCYILGANKIEILSVPVQKSANKIPIKEVKINYSQRWWKEHWRSISSAYGKAPYFQYMDYIFENVYIKKHNYLFDLNWELLTICLKLIGLKIELTISEKYSKKTENHVFDARGLIQPNKNSQLSTFYQPVPYQQVFGNIFVPSLSIIDLLFCEGNNSKVLLYKSIKSN